MGWGPRPHAMSEWFETHRGFLLGPPTGLFLMIFREYGPQILYDDSRKVGGPAAYPLGEGYSVIVAGLGSGAPEMRLAIFDLGIMDFNNYARLQATHIKRAIPADVHTIQSSRIPLSHLSTLQNRRIKMISIMV